MGMIDCRYGNPVKPSASKEPLSTAVAWLYINSAESWRRSGFGQGGNQGRAVLPTIS